MKHLNMYKEKDFVYYTGNNPNYHGKNRVAQIDSIRKSENYWEVKLFLFNPTEQIHCLIDVIAPIFTEKQNLLNLDFKEIKDNQNRTIFKVQNLIISGLYLNISHIRLNYNTGFRLGDLREMTVEKFCINYLVGTEINSDKFQKDFPSVSNINDLITEYSKYYILDIAKIFEI